MRRAVILLTALLLMPGIGRAETEETLPFGLRHHGNFKRMMHTENVAGSVDLATAISGEHVYGVGALANAAGEITVYDGKAYLSYGKNGINTVTHEVPENEQAMLLVSARVEEWREIMVPADMPDHELYLFVLDQAERDGPSTDAPFPFLIEGLVRDLTWHVIDGPAPESERHGVHAFIKRLIEKNREASVSLIGFFSAAIQGTFTHPGE
jgi:acetolactate decarboxylase